MSAGTPNSSGTPSLLIMDAEVDGRSGVDVRVDQHQIVQVGPGLIRRPGEAVLAAGGGAVLPGLHDHHVHLRAAAAARRSLPLDRVRDPADFDRTIRAAAQSLSAGAWLRGVGWHQHAAGEVDRVRLDALVPDRPVRLQHRGGALWVLNSRALAQVGPLAETRSRAADPPGLERDGEGVLTGRLWRMDGWLRERLQDAEDRPAHEADLAGFAREAAGLGITGFTDATPGRDQADVEALADLSGRRVIEQRMLLMAPAGLRAPASDRVRLGAFKVLLDDDALPSGDELAGLIRSSHRAGVPVAIHCVSAEQLVIATAALQDAGPLAGDRIEHAGVVPPGFASRLAGLGVGVVTQPGFIADRGDDYRRDVAVDEQPWLYPCASLLQAGVAVAAGTDAPFGPADPWLAIATAAGRRTRSGQVLGADERVDPGPALGLWLADPEQLGRSRQVAVGEPGDLCLLDRPLAAALRLVLAEPGQNPVLAVIMGARPSTREG